MNTPRPHIGLAVSNIDQAVSFYRAMLGIEPVKLRDDYAKFSSISPPLNLALNKVKSVRPRTSAEHFGIEVASTQEVNAMRTRVRDAGLPVRDEENVTCCYAVQDKFWMSDPDGNDWEVFTVLADAETRDGPDNTRNQKADGSERSCCAPDCCT